MTMPTAIRIAPDFEKRYPGGSAKATECAMNLAKTADLLVKRISGLLQPFDLTPASGLVLGILADSAAPLPPNEIADRLIISRATMTGIIDSLEKRGHVRRRPNPDDRRSILIELTDSGRDMAGEFRPIIHRQQKLWFSVLSEVEKELFLNSLHKLQAALVEDDG